MVKERKWERLHDKRREMLYLPCECVCSTSSPTVSTIVYPLRRVTAATSRTSLLNVALNRRVCLVGPAPTVSSEVMPYHIMWYNAVLYNMMSYDIMLYNVMPYHLMWCRKIIQCGLCDYNRYVALKFLILSFKVLKFPTRRFSCDEDNVSGQVIDLISSSKWKTEELAK